MHASDPSQSSTAAETPNDERTAAAAQNGWRLRCPRCARVLHATLETLACDACQRDWPAGMTILPCLEASAQGDPIRPRLLLAIVTSIFLIPALTIGLGAIAPIAICLVPIIHAAALIAIALPLRHSVIHVQGSARRFVVFSSRGAETWRRGVRLARRPWDSMPRTWLRTITGGVYFDCGGALRGTIDLSDDDLPRFRRAFVTRWAEPFVPAPARDANAAPPFDLEDEARALPDAYRLFRCTRCGYPTLHLGTIDICPECGSSLHPAAARLLCNNPLERTLFIITSIILFLVFIGLATERPRWSGPLMLTVFITTLIGLVIGAKLLERGRWIVVLQPTAFIVGTLKWFTEIPFDQIEHCEIRPSGGFNDRAAPNNRIDICRRDRPWRLRASFSAPRDVVNTIRARLARWRWEQETHGEPDITSEN